MPRAIRVAITLLALAAGCSAVAKNARAPRQCGEPCAAVSCPNGTRCQVSASCAITCEPLMYQSGL